MTEKPVRVVSGTQGAGPRPVQPAAGHAVKDPVVGLEDEAPPVLDPPAERDEVQVLPVSKDGSVPASEGHKHEQRRVEDGPGKPRWRLEDGSDTPPGFVVNVPPERGLDP